MNRPMFVCATIFISASSAMADGAEFDWSGFRVGAFGAYGSGDSNSSDGADLEPSDPYFGVRAGYGLEVESIFLGIEGEATLADLDDDRGSGAGFLSQDIDNIASVIGVVGLPLNQVMPYAFAGWNWANSERSTPRVDDTARLNGLAVGLGLQYHLMDQWIWRVQLAHYDYGKVSYDIPSNPAVKTTVNAVTLGIVLLFP